MPGASDLIPPQAGHQLLSAAEASAAIHAGTLTSEALVSACLKRIAQREGEVQAWAFIDPELALAQARALDREPPRSWLHGIPVGIKDVIDTGDMPTAYGSPNSAASFSAKPSPRNLRHAIPTRRATRTA